MGVEVMAAHSGGLEQLQILLQLSRIGMALPYKGGKWPLTPGILGQCQEILAGGEVWQLFLLSLSPMRVPSCHQLCHIDVM